MQKLKREDVHRPDTVIDFTPFLSFHSAMYIHLLQNPNALRASFTNGNVFQQMHLIL